MLVYINILISDYHIIIYKILISKFRDAAKENGHHARYAQRIQVSMATPRAATTRHHETNRISGPEIFYQPKYLITPGGYLIIPGDT